ncbi:MAG: response regulator [Deltaproteobacteria bacterium]|nr:response regulator [Deltaproteobacteria bacterium]
MENWQILVVDDEPDVHQITQLALKHRSWRQKKFTITSAASGKEAQQILATKSFNVAFIDVVMETDHAGLDLCRHIRAHCDRSLRLVLRTGQPGVAPEEKILNDYDIDYYLAKSEATPDRLHTLVRAGLRASLDIEMLIALGRQMEGFAVCLQKVSTTQDLAAVMNKSMAALAARAGVRMEFFPNVDTDVGGSARFRAALKQAHEQGRERGVFRNDQGSGLQATEYVMPYEIEVRGQEPGTGFGSAVKRSWRAFFGDPPRNTGMRKVRAGVGVEFESPTLAELRADLAADLKYFMHNWTVAYSALCMQEDSAYQRVVQEFERREQLEAPRGPEM